MGKRKLTHRQVRQIDEAREERRQRARQRETPDGPQAAGELGREQEGLVIAHFGGQVEVEAAGQVRRCHLRANLEGLVTGDRVVWRDGEPTGVVVAQLERDSELSRPDPQGQLRPVAANIDQIVVVVAPLPQPHANLVDRYLVAAEVVGIAPTVLLNKTDLLDADNRTAIEELLAPYPALGYPVMRASCRQQDSIDTLHQWLNGRTSVFVGQSGVGKSSLVNALLPEASLRTGELSPTRNKGTHTTATARLFHLPGGGRLIDSPGIREFGLWHIGREQVEAGFREFHPLLGHCKFRDCRHEQEPDCALLAAVEAGDISELRLASYRHIVNSLSEP